MVLNFETPFPIVVSEFSLIYGSETGSVMVEFVRSAFPQNKKDRPIFCFLNSDFKLHTLNTPLHSEHTFVNPFLICQFTQITITKSNQSLVLTYPVCNSINFMYILTNLYYIAL